MHKDRSYWKVFVFTVAMCSVEGWGTARAESLTAIEFVTQFANSEPAAELDDENIKSSEKEENEPELGNEDDSTQKEETAPSEGEAAPKLENVESEEAPPTENADIPETRDAPIDDLPPNEEQRVDSPDSSSQTLEEGPLEDPSQEQPADSGETTNPSNESSAGESTSGGDEAGGILDAAEEVTKKVITKSQPEDGNKKTATATEEQPAQWEDADDIGLMVGRGSIEVCESITFPLRFVPYVGSAASAIFEWACLLPGGFSVEYVSLYHGNRDSWLWESLVAILLSKLWREWTRWPVVIALTAVATVAFVGAAAVLLGVAFISPDELGSAPAYLPVVASGLMTAAGISYVVVRKVRKWGQDFIFHTVYHLLTAEFESEEAQIKKREVAWHKPSFNAGERLWSLAAVAAGVDPESSWMHMIPVAGPAIKSKRRAAAIKEKMRRLSEDVLSEERDDESLQVMDKTIDALCFMEGGLAAAAQAALVAGTVLFGAGSLLAAIQFTQGENVWTYAAVTGGVGIVGMGVSSTALVLLLVRELVKAVKPYAIPVAYGVIPPQGIFGYFADEEDIE